LPSGPFLVHFTPDNFCHGFSFCQVGSVASALEQTLQRNERVQDRGLPPGRLPDETALHCALAIPVLIDHGQRQPIEPRPRLRINRPVIKCEKVLVRDEFRVMLTLERYAQEEVCI
jgi:hypothetical protein